MTNTDSDRIFIHVHVASNVKQYIHVYVHAWQSLKIHQYSTVYIIPMLLKSSGRSCWCWCLLLVCRTVGAKRLDLVRENQGIRSNIIAARQGRGGGRGVEDSSGCILTRKDAVVECVCIHVYCVWVDVYGYMHMYITYTRTHVRMAGSVVVLYYMYSSAAINTDTCTCMNKCEGFHPYWLNHHEHVCVHMYSNTKSPSLYMYMHRYIYTSVLTWHTRCPHRHRST